MTVIISGTDGVSDVDGTAGTPALRGTDTNTGVFFGTDIVGVSTDGTERMRVDASGNLLVGQTTQSGANAGCALLASGQIVAARSAADVMFINRITNDGTLINFAKDNTTVGAIGSAGSGTELFIGASTANGNGVYFSNGNRLIPMKALLPSDDTQDNGHPSFRWDNIFATNNVIQTSDRNEKQDFETLSEAETRVAVAAKGLLKKYRWKSAVAKKGDDARIHFGIIAQDLKAAFEAEGLDAGRYAMYIKSEWWETQTEVPAVEAQEAVYETQTDEEGNEVQMLVSEAVEGKEAHTRTDTFDTEAEAPEDAVRKERMGVRYNELLAFIIAAL